MNICKYTVLMAGVFSLFSHPVSVKAVTIHCPTPAQIEAEYQQGSLWILRAVVQGQQWGIDERVYTGSNRPELEPLPAQVFGSNTNRPSLNCSFTVKNSISQWHSDVPFSSPPQVGQTCTIDQPQQLSMTCH
jgi:hypothetical protein